MARLQRRLRPPEAPFFWEGRPLRVILLAWLGGGWAPGVSPRNRPKGGLPAGVGVGIGVFGGVVDREGASGGAAGIERD